MAHGVFPKIVPSQHDTHFSQHHGRACLFVRRVRTVHIAVAAPPPRHAVAVAAGKFILAVALAHGAVVLVAAVPAVVLLIAQPPLLDALAVGASELGGGARLIW